MRWKLDICDMSRHKICEQYDSDLKPEGQAYDIALTTEISGWKELTFSLPQAVNGKRNFRWDFIRSGYQIRLMRDGAVDWFLLNAPKRTHKGTAVTAAITCQHVCALLQKKHLYLTFDDANGIGTAQYLLEQVLDGTGWQLAFCETFFETDGATEKVRSIHSEGKRGAYQQIGDICKLFGARPVFDGDLRAVSVYSLDRHEEMLEQSFGKNLISVDRKEDAENVVTRLHVEGEYGDGGYVGIDEVNPTGLPFLLDFSYFRELGTFTAAHEQALSDYLRDIAAAKADGSETAMRLIQLDGQMNALWGQIDYVLYLLQNNAVARTILGGAATDEHARITDEDELTVLLSDGTHRQQTDWAIGTTAQYAVKFVRKASAAIGGKEVAIEAKRASADSLSSKLETETDPARKQSILEQIEALETGIQAIYQGSEGSEGLYAMMRRAVLLAVERADADLAHRASLNGQRQIEERFALALGDMLIDGYWSNTSYAVGQEELLYREACEIMAKLAKPSVSYTVNVQNLSGISGYERERFSVNMVQRIWDEALCLNDLAYVTKLTENPETPEKDSITISNDLSGIGGISLDGIIARIAGIAEILQRKQALYDRAKAISGDGSIPAKRLEGMIDVLRTRLTSSVSNWYTDDSGNLILEAVNGQSAMQLCGEGFMIASSKTDDGKWDWRTFGTGEGFAADLLVTGFLSADRIQAHTITANKLASDVGESLDLSSNESISLTVKRTVIGALEETIGQRVEISSDAGDVLSQYVPSTMLRARVFKGAIEVTDQIDAGRFLWKRISADDTADHLWNAAHQGVKTIRLTTADVFFSATYQCAIAEG